MRRVGYAAPSGRRAGRRARHRAGLGLALAAPVLVPFGLTWAVGEAAASGTQGQTVVVTGPASWSDSAQAWARGAGVQLSYVAADGSTAAGLLDEGKAQAAIVAGTVHTSTGAPRSGLALRPCGRGRHGRRICRSRPVHGPDRHRPAGRCTYARRALHRRCRLGRSSTASPQPEPPAARQLDRTRAGGTDRPDASAELLPGSLLPPGVAERDCREHAPCPGPGGGPRQCGGCRRGRTQRCNAVACRPASSGTPTRPRR